MKQFILFLFLTCYSLMAQNQFVAQASKNNITLNEKVTIEFSMNFDGDNFEAPQFELSGFRVIFGPSQSISQAWINGKSSYNKSYSYVLIPTKKGTLSIKQAEIEYNGKIYKSAPIKITVTDAEPEPTQNSAPIAGKVSSKSLFLVAEISNSNPYLNEPIEIVYKLFFGYNVALTSDWNEVGKPKYNNFWSQNIDVKDLVAEEGIYKGERIRYAILRKAILYPQKTGNLEIEPLTLDIDYEIATGRTDFFGQMETITANKRVTSGSKVIAVKPLPIAGKPDSFDGAVGNFTFDITPSRTTVKNGEPIDLVITIAGTGNLKLFNLPKPILNEELEVYDPEHKENVTTQSNGMTGNITDKYTIIPQYKGDYAIKPIEFSYFDTQSKSYKTLASKEIKINVLDGPIASGNKPLPKNDTSKTQIKTQVAQQNNFVGSGLFYTLMSLPILAIAGFLIVRKTKNKKQKEQSKSQISELLAKKYLSDAKIQFHNKEAFYIALEKSMHNFLKAKLHIETSDISKERIKELLLSKNCDNQSVIDFIKLMENCEIARYAPSSQVTIQQDFEKAEAIITSLNKNLS
jgi:hypothetical protein